jgi:two-component system chemotaxis response regulator CheB
VLIVDDSAMMRSIARKVLEMDGTLRIVGEAENGYVALERAKQLKPDVVLLDIEMPKMDGLETLRRLKLISRARVVILSSVAQAGSPQAAEARRLGAAAVLAKPSGAISLDLQEKSGHQLLQAIHRARAQGGAAEEVELAEQVSPEALRSMAQPLFRVLTILVAAPPGPRRDQLIGDLGRLGCPQIHPADGNEAAMARVRKEIPRIMLAELAGGPAMDGLKLVEELREASFVGLTKIPTILIAAKIAPEQIQRAKSLDVDGLVLHPATEESLYQRIRAALARVAAQRPTV